MTLPRNRSVKGTEDTTVLLEKIPRQLVDDAKAKCKTEQPPSALKWKIVELLGAWVYGKKRRESKAP